MAVVFRSLEIRFYPQDFQFGNLLDKNPELAQELFQRMRTFMLELRTS